MPYLETGISEITVKAHRGRVMQKMNAGSLPELVTIAARLGLPTASGSRRDHDSAAHDPARPAD